MKGDFSRQTFSPEKHYSGVRLQQGRAHLDADWNEQVDIEAYRDAATTRDVIGPAGAPFDGGGFGLSGGSFLRGIDLLDADQGWAVGERAAILRTSDKGASWALQPAPANVGHLNAVQVVAANSAWAVGDGGTLLRFDGSGWTRVTVPNVSASLHAIDAFDATHVWAVGDGGIVLFWDGANWSDRKVPQLSASLRGVHFATASKGWVVGDGGTIAVTTDAGLNWTMLSAPPGTPRLRSVFFTSANSGCVVGDGGTILSTADAGATWARRSLSGVSAVLRAVRFESAGQNGWAVGHDGTVVVTMDGGASWKREDAADAGVGDLTGLAVFGGTRLACGAALVVHRETGPVRWVRGPMPAQGRDLVISAGDLYLDGVRCENERPVSFTSQPDLPGALPAPPNATELRGAYLVRHEEHLTAVEREEIREQALRGPDTSTRTRVSWQVRLTGPLADDRCSTLAAALPGAGRAGRLRARSEPVEIAASECSVAPAGGYRRLENQLYRVEIHDGGPIDPQSTNGHATYKWSRDNGSMVARLEGLDQAGLTVTVSTTGRDDVLGFAPEQWVEVNDESRMRRGLPGILLEIDLIEDRELEVLSFPPRPGGGSWSMADFPVNPTVRRWDGQAAVPEDWEELEDGVQVEFGAGPFATGDFWTLPARTVTGAVEWPRENGVPGFRPPEGEPPGVAALGVVRAHPDGTWEFVRDCRSRFPSLTSLADLYYVGGDGQEAMPDSAAPQNRVQLARPLEVGVSNWRWPVEGARVRFTVKSGGGTLDGQSATEVITATNNLGIASCAWLVDGSNPDQRVEAYLLDEDDEPVQTPVHFGANLSIASRVAFDPGGCAGLSGAKNVQAAIAALAGRARLEKVGGDDQELMPGEGADPLQVRIVSDCGAVSGARVQFLVVDPAPAGGTVNGQRDITLGPTPNTGVLTANWALGNGRGTQYVDAILVDVNGVAVPQPAPAARFAATLSTADHVRYEPPAGCASLKDDDTVQEAIDRLAGMVSLYRLRGDGQRVSPGGASSLRPLEVLVASGCGPVKDASVEFTIREGKGKLQGESTQVVLKTRDDGVAACDWDLDPGTPSQVVEAKLVALPDSHAGAVIQPPVLTEFTAHLAVEGTMRPSARVAMVRAGEIPDIQAGRAVEVPMDTLQYETVPEMHTGDGLRAPAHGIYLATVQVTWSQDVTGAIELSATIGGRQRRIAWSRTVGSVLAASTTMMLAEGSTIGTRVVHFTDGAEPALEGKADLQHMTLTWLGPVHPSLLPRGDRPPIDPDRGPVIVRPIGPLIVDADLPRVITPDG
jgi:photosystem II stability/assembly factor-like uncharacterized protein